MKLPLYNADLVIDHCNHGIVWWLEDIHESQRSSPQNDLIEKSREIHYDSVKRSHTLQQIQTSTETLRQFTYSFDANN